MKTLVIFAAVALVAGCTTSSPTHGPNGKAAHSISCNGGANSWGSCYEKAGSLCGAAGYDIVMQNGSVTPFGMANGYANAAGGSFSGVGGGLVSRSLLVQCRAPA
jgi:hypothetical protein